MFLRFSLRHPIHFSKFEPKLLSSCMPSYSRVTINISSRHRTIMTLIFFYIFANFLHTLFQTHNLKLIKIMAMWKWFNTHIPTELFPCSIHASVCVLSWIYIGHMIALVRSLDIRKFLFVRSRSFVLQNFSYFLNFSFFLFRYFHFYTIQSSFH